MDKKTWLILAAAAVGGYLLYRKSRKKATPPSKNVEDGLTTSPGESGSQGGSKANQIVVGGQTITTGGVRPVIPSIPNSSPRGTTFDNEQQETAFSAIATQVSPPDIGFQTQPRVLNVQNSGFGTRLSAPAEAMFVGYQVPQFGVQRIDANF